MKPRIGVMIILAFAASSRGVAAGPSPLMERPQNRPPAQFTVTLIDERRANIAVDFKAADNAVKALLMSAVNLEGFDIWHRAQMQKPGRPGEDFDNDLKRFSYYFRDFAQKCQEADVRLHKLADAASSNPSLVPLAESLARHTADLRERAIWLEAQSRDGAPDLRLAGFLNDAADFQRTGLRAAELARDIDAQAAALLQKVRSML